MSMRQRSRAALALAVAGLLTLTACTQVTPDSDPSANPDGGEMVAVNLRCAEDLDLSTVKVTQFDGASL